MRLAMWSGPRNISTAMMRSFGNRSDTAVVDEPLYAHYLAVTGLQHPGREEIIAHHDAEWPSVVRDLCGPVPNGRRVFYQKQMAHHLLPMIDRAWLHELEHAFLIRDPAAMLLSLSRRLDRVGLDDTGLPQQVEIFRTISERSGAPAPVLDAGDVLRDPEGMLRLLCRRLDLPFEETMLRWEAGRRTTDGIWARHWYDKVEASTGFGPPREEDTLLPDALRPLLDACLPLYEELSVHRLKVTDAPTIRREEP